MLSYARPDLPFARCIHRRLQDQGFRVWVDWEQLATGAAWLTQVERAIEAATYFAFVLSPHALRSANCRLELLHARRCGKPVVCFRPLSAAGSTASGATGHQRDRSRAGR